MKRVNKFHRRFLGIIFVLALISSSFFPQWNVKAQAESNSTIEALLVMDASNSMNDSDRDKISQEAMKMFVDMSSVKGDKIGVVTYTDQVNRERAMMDMSTPQAKGDLKGFIDELNRGPYTDISVGLNEAIKLLDAGHTGTNVPFVILLADGNNDVNKSTGRTNQQADQDVLASIQQAKQKGYPIYTIGLNADGTLNQPMLQNISSQTNGKFFATTSAADLPGILSQIFADHLKLKVQNVSSFIANGDYQDVKINVPNSSVVEANISIMSDNPVDVQLIDPSGKQIVIPSDNIILTKSSKYSMLKILKPQKGDWLLKVKGVSQNKIDVNLVFNYDLKLKTEPLQSTYKTGQKVNVKAYFESNGERLDSADLYQEMKGTLLVTDKKTKKTSEIAMNNEGNNFQGTYTVQNGDPLELKVRVDDKSFYRESDLIQINNGAAKATAAAPKAKSAFPWAKILLIIGGIVVLLVVILVLRNLIRGRKTPMVGQFGIEIRDNDSFEYESPQYRQLNIFTNKANFHQIMGFRNDFAETSGVVINRQNGYLELSSTSTGCIVEKDGELIEGNKKARIYIGDMFTIKLSSVNKTISVKYVD